MIARKDVCPLQVWFAFSGNGSQWSKMGVTLLQSNRVFREAVEECATSVKPHGIDLMAEFTKARGWASPLLGAVGLLAVQIGLVDVLAEDYGIKPAGMLGHSAGESWLGDGSVGNAEPFACGGLLARWQECVIVRKGC